ncbi:hypothetical protein H1R20_g1801, partial [Candolleomyces eurysporus]
MARIAAWAGEARGCGRREDIDVDRPCGSSPGLKTVRFSRLPHAYSTTSRRWTPQDTHALQDGSAVDRPRLPDIPPVRIFSRMNVYRLISGRLQPGKRPIDPIIDFLSCLWEYIEYWVTKDIGAVAAQHGGGLAHDSSGLDRERLRKDARLTIATAL